MSSNENILAVKNLRVVLQQGAGRTLIHDSTFDVHRGECLCILGESGSGKSLTMQAIMGLLDNNFAVSGQALFEGKNLLAESAENMRLLRGSKLAMVMQNPMTAFDPLMRIEDQIAETFSEHSNNSNNNLTDDAPSTLTRQDVKKYALEIFNRLQIKDPEETIRKYPHQLSGGMLQRIMIGIALMLRPNLLIADEPTTALDALTQMEVLKAFRAIKMSGTAMVFITHDLGVANYIADRIIVMNSGRIVDRGTFGEILQQAQDEYTKLLIEKRSAVMQRYEKVLKGGALYE